MPAPPATRCAPTAPPSRGRPTSTTTTWRCIRWDRRLPTWPHRRTALSSPSPRPPDGAAPANGRFVNIPELLTSNLLHQRPPATETFTYITGANYGNGTVHGVLAGAPCTYNP